MLAGGPSPLGSARSALSPSRPAIGSAGFGSSAVPVVLRGLVEMIAEIFRPLLCPLPRHAYPPLFYTFFVVGDVPEFPELRAGLGVQNGLQRFFDGLTTPVRPSLRLAHQDLVGHLLDALIFAHGALLFLAETLPRVSITLPGFSGPTDRGCAAFKGRGRPLGRLMALSGWGYAASSNGRSQPSSMNWSPRKYPRSTMYSSPRSRLRCAEYGTSIPVLPEMLTTRTLRPSKSAFSPRWAASMASSYLIPVGLPSSTMRGVYQRPPLSEAPGA